MGYQTRAATNNPFGMEPYGPILRVAKYNKDASAGYISVGEVLYMNTDGRVDPITTGEEGNVVGVAAATYASGSAAEILVYDHPMQLFAILDDGVSQLAATSIGNCANLVVRSPDTNTGRTRTTMNSSVATTQLMVKIQELHPIESSFPSATSDPRKWIVQLNSLHAFYATPSGV